MKHPGSPAFLKGDGRKIRDEVTDKVSQLNIESLCGARISSPMKAPEGFHEPTGREAAATGG